MKTAACKLIEYRGVNYLTLTEKKELKSGDRVLLPMFIPLGLILGPAGGWDNEGFYAVSNTSSAVSFWGNALDVVVAVENEIKPEDLIQLKQNIVCSIYLENDKPKFLNGKIEIKY